MRLIDTTLYELELRDDLVIESGDDQEIFHELMEWLMPDGWIRAIRFEDLYIVYHENQPDEFSIFEDDNVFTRTFEVLESKDIVACDLNILERVATRHRQNAR